MVVFLKNVNIYYIKEIHICLNLNTLKKYMPTLKHATPAKKNSIKQFMKFYLPEIKELLSSCSSELLKKSGAGKVVLCEKRRRKK